MSGTAASAKGLTKRYGSTLALHELTLDIPHNSVFALLGINGAGKTTTFDLFCGFLRPNAGECSVLDVPSSQLYRLRGRVAALPQDAAFPSQLSIEVQLRHWAALCGMRTAESHRAAQEALESVDLWDARSLRGSELSHGMRKRAGVAQAFLGKPEVVFLDEPTAGLDPSHARRLRTLFREKSSQCTIVISSHNLTELQDVCSHGAILVRGELAASGTMESLTKGAHEVRFDTRGELPLERLDALCGKDGYRIEGHTLIVGHRAEERVHDVIRRVIEVLYDFDVELLGVVSGQSLESAFLQVVDGSSAR